MAPNCFKDALSAAICGAGPPAFLPREKASIGLAAGKLNTPPRASLPSATRQLISFHLPLGERQSNHWHTRRDKARREISGFRSIKPPMRSITEGENDWPHITMPQE